MGPSWGVGTREGEDVGKECRRVNMVQISCICVCKWKLFQQWGREIKERDGGGEFRYDIL
jgi:hypothetical protein